MPIQTEIYYIEIMKIINNMEGILNIFYNYISKSLDDMIKELDKYTKYKNYIEK